MVCQLCMSPEFVGSYSVVVTTEVNFYDSFSVNCGRNLPITGIGGLSVLRWYQLCLHPKVSRLPTQILVILGFYLVC